MGARRGLPTTLMLSLGAVSMIGVCLRAQGGGQGKGGIVTPHEIIIGSTPQGPVFADPKGYTLYVTERDRDPERSTCVGPCATEWPPLRAATDAQPFGDWALVPRDDGAPQWAYKGRPLYRYRHEARTNWAEAQGDIWRVAYAAPFPPRGQRLRYGQVSDVAKTRVTVPDVPSGVVGQVTPSGVVLADFNGMTLYTVPGPCTGRCLDTWIPLAAPWAAMPSGEWTRISLPDGAVQWARKGQALYRCAKDAVAGDTNCEKVENGGGRAVRVPPALPPPAVVPQ